MMFLACILLLVELTTGFSVKQHSRFYDPEEDNIDRMHYIYMPDEHGQVHLIDLTKDRDAKVTVSTSDVSFYLYTKNNKEDGHEISAEDIQSLTSYSFYDKSKMNVFIAHGWTGDYSSTSNTVLKSVILDKYDVNIFVVDWNAPASHIYVKAKNAVPKVGVIIGNFINDMINKFGLTPSDFNLIGHSLGAHVVGCAGAQVAAVYGKVSSIGLDPAGPLYTVKNKDNRIDSSNAQFVHIIHTNGGLLGFSSAIGHADYYSNGGNSQPGCGVDLTGGCSHARSYLYFAESITSPEFHAVYCDSYKNFKKEKCNSNVKSLLGGFLVDRRADGDYYLNTGKEDPYALGDIES